MFRAAGSLFLLHEVCGVTRRLQTYDVVAKRGDMLLGNDCSRLRAAIGRFSCKFNLSPPRSIHVRQKKGYAVAKGIANIRGINHVGR
jgi:hypothetical protein